MYDVIGGERDFTQVFRNDMDAFLLHRLAVEVKRVDEAGNTDAEGIGIDVFFLFHWILQEEIQRNHMSEIRYEVETIAGRLQVFDRSPGPFQRILQSKDEGIIDALNMIAKLHVPRNRHKRVFPVSIQVRDRDPVDITRQGDKVIGTNRLGALFL